MKFFYRNTVRKRKTRKGPSGVNVIKPIDEEESENTFRTSRKLSDTPMTNRIKPDVFPRKFSSPDPVTKGGRQKLSISPSSTPPRPRVTLIKRAKDTPQENFEERRNSASNRSLSPSPGGRGRSPSPGGRGLSPSLQTSRKKQFLGSSENIDKEPGPVSLLSSDNSPSAQETANMVIKYVLSLNNPELKSALIEAVSSDPKILEALKK